MARHFHAALGLKILTYDLADLAAEFGTGWIPGRILPERYPELIRDLRKRATAKGRGDTEFTIGTDVGTAKALQASGGAQGLEIIRQLKPSVVLLDVNLPGLSGLDFLTQIQNEAAHTDIEPPLVVIITAHGSERMAVQAVKSGASGYLGTLMATAPSSGAVSADRLPCMPPMGVRAPLTMTMLSWDMEELRGPGPVIEGGRGRRF